MPHRPVSASPRLAPPHLPGPPPPPTETPAKARQDPVHQLRDLYYNLGAVFRPLGWQEVEAEGSVSPGLDALHQALQTDTPSDVRTGVSPGDPTQAQAQARVFRRLKRAGMGTLSWPPPLRFLQREGLQGVQFPSCFSDQKAGPSV